MHSFLHYLNGKWTDSPTLSFFDLSVIRGFGVFDFLRTYDHKPFRLDDHIDRLFNSANQLGITVPKTKSQIKTIVFKGIKKNSLPDYNIRIVVTGGVSPDGISRSDSSTLAVLFAPAIDYPASYYTKGVAVITKRHERPFPSVKSLNYLTAVDVLAEAKKKNAVEVVYTDSHGHILEGTTSNFFAVIGGKLVTAKDDILHGITRKVVLEIAQKIKIPVIETELLYSQLDLFDEAFISASNKEVMPVVNIDGKKVGNGKVGKITANIIISYKSLVR